MGWGYILLGICEGVDFQKIVTASGGGVGSFARRPSNTPTFSETILSTLKLKMIYILLGICEGEDFQKIVTASGGGVSSFARRPSITPTFSETILSTLKLKIIIKKQNKSCHQTT